MFLNDSLSDKSILAELGERLSWERVYRGITQAQLALAAGIGKRTLERLEAGEPVQTPTLVRVLRALKLTENLNAMAGEVRATPLDELSNKGRVRERAYSPRSASKHATSTAEDDGWKWGDEK